MVWFLTPQAVLTTGTFDGSGNEVVSAAMQMLSTEYLGYTLALFMLFTMFVATITYYYTLVRYRVLMSFVVMIFPFMIYAREDEKQKILVICSYSKDTLKFKMPKGFDRTEATLMLQNYKTVQEDTLKPYETRVYLFSGKR